VAWGCCVERWHAGGKLELLITAGNCPDEASAADYIRAGAPDSVRIWQASTPGTPVCWPSIQEWEQRVIGFVADSLGPPARQ
jgi:hypothetical protein